MGDPERWPQASSLTPEGVSLFSAAFSASVAQGNDWWAKAEEWAAELITCIQPTWSSEKRRQSVVDYVQFLIRRGIDCQVGVLKIPLFGSCALEAQLGFSIHGAYYVFGTHLAKVLPSRLHRLGWPEKEFLGLQLWALLATIESSWLECQ